MKFAGFQEREIRIRDIREGWPRGKAPRDDAESARYVGGSNPPPSTKPMIPREHLIEQEVRSQGASLVYRIETAAKETDGVEEHDPINP